MGTTPKVDPKIVKNAGALPWEAMLSEEKSYTRHAIIFQTKWKNHR